MRNEAPTDILDKLLSDVQRDNKQAVIDSIGSQTPSPRVLQNLFRAAAYYCSKDTLSYLVDNFKKIIGSQAMSDVVIALTAKWYTEECCMIIEQAGRHCFKQHHKNAMYLAACRHGRARIAEAALWIGADVNTLDRDGKTGLMMAAETNNHALTKAIIKFGPNTGLKIRREKSGGINSILYLTHLTKRNVKARDLATDPNINEWIRKQSVLSKSRYSERHQRMLHPNR